MSNKGWVLVTGYSGGIGTEVTRRLLAHGFSVYGLARSTSSKFSQDTGAQEIRSATADLTNLESLPTIIKSVNDEVGPLRGFVHCAGNDLLRPMYLTKPQDYEQLMRLHALAPLLTIGELARGSRISQGFSCVILSSLAVHEGAKGHVAYAAAKGALSGSLKAVAAELVSKGGRVNLISPGIIETHLSEEWLSRLAPEKVEEIRSVYPLGFGLPSDIAAITLFLLSDESRWITGQEIIADGGRLVS